jgi:acyl carrier protein
MSWTHELSILLTETFPGRDFPDTVSYDTGIMSDFGLSSIEIIVLGEKVEKHYGKKLPYAMFLRELRQRGATDITLGDLVAFLEQSGIHRG